MGQTPVGKIRIQTTEQAGNVVFLPETWRATWGRTREHVRLRAGNRQATAQIRYAKDKEVRVSKSVQEQLCLPQTTLSVKWADDELHFGPCVALYALPSDKPGRPFGELTVVFADMMKLAEEIGMLLYVTTPGEIHWKRGYAVGTVLRGGKWVQSKRPLPDLVITKMTNRPAPWRERIEHDLAQIAKATPYGTFNSVTGDKWTVHNILHPDQETNRYLPETHLVQAPRDIESMLTRYGDIYIKPAYGTKGMSIFRVHLTDGAVAVKYNAKGVSQIKRIRRGSAPWLPFLQRTFCGKRKFLVQQTISLVTSQDGSPVDFRWLVQKDGQNRWSVTARVARIGVARSITTNLHTGGAAVLADDFLRQNGYREEKRRDDILEQMDRAALRIAHALEAKAGQIGELGIDLGLTTEGRVYLIEINPRPGRMMLKHTSPQLRLLSLLRNLEYAMYVTGYGRISE